jgi:16S rRNA (guanine(966)-N(2))-methyltransferase RsmD
MNTRPTADRVREAVFNILHTHIYGAYVLDLFAGTGAMALEALSRGAARAVLIDNDRAAVMAVKRNINNMRCADRARLIAKDWREALKELRGERFSLVFIDPPHQMPEAHSQAARALDENGLLDINGIVVLEHPSANAPILPARYNVYDARRYGETMISLARLKYNGANE